MKNANQFDPDDPRLTAYALGELDGEDLDEVAALIASNSKAAALVDELRATSGVLAREFESEMVAASRPAVNANARSRAYRPNRARPLQLAGLAAGIALLTAVAAYVFSPVLLHSKHSEEETSSIQDERARAGQSESEVPMLLARRGPAVRSRAGELPAAQAIPAAGADEGEEVIEDKVQQGIAIHSASAAGVLSSPARAGKKFDGDRDGALGAFYDRAGREELRAKVEELYDGEKDIPSNTEGYNAIVENAFKLASQDPLSTFSIDVDTASYANVRRFLNDGHLPPADAVRVEELINYFRYAYPAPEGNAPFSTTANVASCPWAPTHKLVQVGLRARDIDMSKRLPSNFVFLIDVSGSMDEPDKLPLLKRSMRLLVDQLDARDRIAIVVYAGASGLALPSTTCASKAQIEHAIESLQPGGSTNGAAGIELAYEIAGTNRIEEGQNRVILCTDGDFNVGVTDQGSLVRLIEEKRKSNVFLSVLGFGRGNVKDSTMEMLADKGNGNYAYIDSLNEARKVLVSEMGGTLFTVAKDVKIQVEFNPTRVQAWRLIGYENRQLAHQDFNDDKKDAGEIGAGHNVTAFYEIIPIGAQADVPSVDPLKYQQPTATTSAAYTDELLTLKLRYKAPESDTSQLISTPVADTNRSWTEAPSDFRFAASVAAFGMVLRHSQNAAAFSLQNVIDLAVPEIGDDTTGYRREFVDLVRKAQAITGKPAVR